jgi:putative addiction module killer protein
MILIRQTPRYSKWIDNLKDQNAVGRIEIRVRRLSLGNAGDVKPVGEGVSELRIHYGAGYRVYFVNRSVEIIVILCGGDKTTQADDIKTAKALAKELQ